MKKIIRIIAVMIITVMAIGIMTSVNATSDKTLCRKYIKAHYKGYKVKFIESDKLTTKEIETRKGKKIVLVEMITSKSYGKYGLTKNGWYICYNRKVKKGKIVKSYCIFNPKNNYIDDTIAVIDNKRIRE